MLDTPATSDQPFQHTYSSGEVACRCCGLPIGAGSAADSNGKRCFNCARLSFVQYAAPHKIEACHQDRDAVVALYERMISGDPTAYGEHVLPSGRTIEATAPDA